MVSWQQVKRFLIGEPLISKHEKHQKLNITMGLSVFAADALSSSAYATDEVLLALVAGHGVFTGTQVIQQIGIPVATAIVCLIVLVVVSYQQVIRAYPDGGGSYVVSKQNLGEMPSLIAGAALLIDYVLTVSVSVCAGVGALISAGWLPSEYRTLAAVVADVIILLVNLRGMKESGALFSIPVFTFLLATFTMLGMGVYQVATGQLLPDATHIPSNASLRHVDAHIPSFLALSLFLKGFSHGCAGLTGIEAVSDGVKAFKEPAARNASITLAIMGILLGVIFVGLTWLSVHLHIEPTETSNVISQLAGSVFGKGTAMFNATMGAVMLLLLLAANTAFADFPRVCSFLADDGYLPRQLMSLGDRLVFSNGIIILGMISILLIILFRGDTHALIPLYSVGVFICFTSTQASLLRYHVKEKEPGWQTGVVVNGVGALVTGIVTLVLAYEKFTEGAYLLFIAMPILILIFKTIREHYRSIGRQLALPEAAYCPQKVNHTVVVLVASLNKGTLAALEYAKSISDNVEAVHVELKPEATQRLRKAWDSWGCGLPLVILKSPFRTLLEPLLDYIEEVDSRYDHDLVTIVVPEFVTRRFWHNFLHNQTALYIKAALSLKKGKVVTTVRYHLDE